MERVLDGERLERLLEAGRGLLADMDLGLVLDRLLDLARELTGARYAALGILDERRNELAQFLTVGIDEETHQAIGDLPRGRGILGVLIEDPRPLRLHDVNADPRSYGFPPDHPRMTSFLGTPVLIRGQAWGNLYLTGKVGGGDFDEADEASAVVLAEWAAMAIENARLYEAVDARRAELERAVHGFEATAAIARAVGGETDLERVLELIVKRGRALVGARSLVILLAEGDGLRAVARAGEEVERARVDGVAAGADGADGTLVVPLVFRGRPLGVLAAFDPLTGAAGFGPDDESALEAFAASAATAVWTAQTVEADRLRASIRAADEERRRWARELHDETLQGLGALRVLLSGAARSDDAARVGEALTSAVEQVTQEIAALRSIIADLRPAALDELGLEPALSGLLQRTAAGARTRGRGRHRAARAAADAGAGDDRLPPRAGGAVQRRQARAGPDRAGRVRQEGEALRVRVADDGVGFDPGTPSAGYGLTGMHERVALAGGALEVRAGARGRRSRRRPRRRSACAWRCGPCRCSPGSRRRRGSWPRHRRAAAARRACRHR